MGAWNASAARRTGGGDAPSPDALRGAARASIESEANRLVEAYADTILRVSYTYLRSTHDAEDICQDVLLKALDRTESFESAEHERAWIVRVAINAAKDLLRRQSERGTVALDEIAEPAIPLKGGTHSRRDDIAAILHASASRRASRTLEMVASSSISVPLRAQRAQPI